MISQKPHMGQIYFDCKHDWAKSAYFCNKQCLKTGKPCRRESKLVQLYRFLFTNLFS